MPSDKPVQLDLFLDNGIYFEDSSDEEFCEEEDCPNCGCNWREDENQ